MTLPGDIEVEEAIHTLRQIREETCDPEDIEFFEVKNDYALLLEAERTVRAIYKRVRPSEAHE